MSTDAIPPSGSANEQLILHHKPGLFVLFFTEMWERFSYYGMRALLVLFLTASLFEEGWGWGRAEALQLYAFYTGLVYVTPILGGFLADMFFGYRLAVILGALIMTIGHASMAFETVGTFYLGLICLILGNGLFKPNISSIVGQLYEQEKQKRDAAYTIFYMGINAGAFMGILLCGYIGEKVGWRFGFGLAGIFMFLGMVQFYFAQNIFGDIGQRPLSKETLAARQATQASQATAGEKSKQPIEPHVERDRIIVILVFAFFTIFFWWAFEQAGGSMTIFAADYTDRVLDGGQATAYKIVNTLLTVVPLLVVTTVLVMLFRVTFGSYPLSNLCLGCSFVVIWAIAIWLIQNDFNTRSYSVSYTDINGQTQTSKIRTTEDLQSGAPIDLVYNLSIQPYEPSSKANAGHLLKNGEILNQDGERLGAHRSTTLGEIIPEQSPGLLWKSHFVSDVQISDASGKSIQRQLTLPTDHTFEPNGPIELMVVDRIALPRGESGTRIQGKVLQAEDQEIEVPASWFGILNSFFIIAFAPLFSRFWEMNLVKSGPIKFAMGLFLLGIGFAALAYGASGIAPDAKVAQVSMLWLILAYLFHTLGELCLSPVGLSYVSKLAPVRLVGLMFGIWFVANFVANTAAGLTGSYIDAIAEEHSLSVFFLIFTAIPIGAGIVLVLLNGVLRRMMHGID